MKLTMLGTGSAMVTECYNTCFVLSEGKESFMVDGGGGNTIMHQLKQAGVDWREVRHIFVTHKHVDHVMGIIWMIRFICQNMQQGKYEGDAWIYAHQELIEMIQTISCMLLQKKQTDFLGKRLHMVSVEDGQEVEIMNRKVVFFDIHSTKAKQYGFTMHLNETEKLTCCGDEPYNEQEKQYVENSKWLMHEAFCLYSQADVFHPYEKHHSTVKDACELAQKLNVKNLILYHTEDKNIANRKELYLAEGKQSYCGNLFVPDDLESFEL